MKLSTFPTFARQSVGYLEGVDEDIKPKLTKNVFNLRESAETRFPLRSADLLRSCEPKWIRWGRSTGCRLHSHDLKVVNRKGDNPLAWFCKSALGCLWFA